MADRRFDTPSTTASDKETEIKQMNPDELQAEIHAVDERIKALQERKAELLRSLGHTGTESSIRIPTLQTRPAQPFPRRRGTW